MVSGLRSVATTAATWSRTFGPTAAIRADPIARFPSRRTIASDQESLSNASIFESRLSSGFEQIPQSAMLQRQLLGAEQHRPLGGRRFAGGVADQLELAR